MCNLINTGAKAGIVQRLEAEVKGQNAIYRFKWDNFYKYLEGGERVQKEYDSHPVIVPAKDSKLLRIQFKTDDGGKCEWKLGEEYEFRVFGWMNLEDRKKPRNLESATFHFQIDQDFIEHQKNPGQEGMYVPRPFIEWEREQQ